MGGFGNFDSHYYHIFDANADNNNWGNPMKGHAVGTDIHPYSMRILYLIAYQIETLPEALISLELKMVEFGAVAPEHLKRQPHRKKIS